MLLYPFKSSQPALSGPSGILMLIIIYASNGVHAYMHIHAHIQLCYSLFYFTLVLLTWGNICSRLYYPRILFSGVERATKHDFEASIETGWSQGYNLLSRITLS